MMDVADAGDRAHRPLAPEDDPALIEERLVQPAAQHLHGEPAFRRHPAHYAAQLVHVRVDHHPRSGRALLRDHRTEAVEGELVARRAHALDHDFAHRLLEAGRAVGVGELLQQRHRLVGRSGQKGKRQEEHPQPCSEPAAGASSVWPSAAALFRDAHICPANGR
jgi:hypothetical protein